MAVVCREFGICRKTAYQLFNRYQDLGLEGLQDQSRRPYRHANNSRSKSNGRFGGSSGKGRAGARPRLP